MRLGKLKKLKLGNTIIFGCSKTMGINEERYPSPSYDRYIDAIFFKYIGSESFYPDGCAGCSKSKYKLYKTVSKGTTTITKSKKS